MPGGGGVGGKVYTICLESVIAGMGSGVTEGSRLITTRQRRRDAPLLNAQTSLGRSRSNREVENVGAMN